MKDEFSKDINIKQTAEELNFSRGGLTFCLKNNKLKKSHFAYIVRKYNIKLDVIKERLKLD